MAKYAVDPSQYPGSEEFPFHPHAVEDANGRAINRTVVYADTDTGKVVYRMRFKPTMLAVMWAKPPLRCVFYKKE